MKRYFFLLNLSIALGALSACSSLQRSNAYNQQIHPQEYLSAKDLRDVEESKYELNMQNSSSLSDAQIYYLNNRVKVKQLERSLESSLDKELYYKNKAFFLHDLERIEFLQLPTYAEKKQWLDRKSFEGRLSKYSKEVENAIEQNDLVIHMSMKAVRESWGEPEEREISGKEFYGNERWTYNHYYSSPEGYKQQKRIIFFQHGKVVAWRTLPTDG